MRIVYSAGLGRLVSDSELQESNEKSSSVWERRIWTEKRKAYSLPFCFLPDTAGYIIMIACDHDGIITRCEIMQGLSFLAKFKPLNEFLGKDMKGRSIYEFLDDMKDFDKKQKKKYKGYINAFEALDQRLQDTKLEEDQKEAVSQEAQDALA